MKAVKLTDGSYRFTEWSRDEIVDFLKEELQYEKNKYNLGEENHYHYLWMLCNDMGLTGTCK